MNPRDSKRRRMMALHNAELRGREEARSGKDKVNPYAGRKLRGAVVGLFHAWERGYDEHAKAHVVPKPRKMGDNQASWLGIICERKRWYPGCGFYWGSDRRSVKLCEALESRGYLESQDQDFDIPLNRTVKIKVWKPTDSGRDALAKLRGIL